jgi:hypothetical protein
MLPSPDSFIPSGHLDDPKMDFHPVWRNLGFHWFEMVELLAEDSFPFSGDILIVSLVPATTETHELKKLPSFR